MKNVPANLLYHSLHKRPMPGCLPLFFLLAAVVTGAVMWLVKVEPPKRVFPRGAGSVQIQNDEMTSFQVRQRSAMPLHLPRDPAVQLPWGPHELSPTRPVTPLPAPPLPIITAPPDSAVLDADSLLRLPPPTQETEVAP